MCKTIIVIVIQQFDSFELNLIQCVIVKKYNSNRYTIREESLRCYFKFHWKNQ